MSVASVSVRPGPSISVRTSTSALLVVALVAATGWTVLSGGWTEALPSAVLVGVLGSLEGLILGRARIARGLFIVVMPLLLFASLLPVTFGSRPAAPAGGIPHLVTQYASAAASGLLGNSPWEFNVSLGALLWLCGAWTAWLAVREGRAALATAPAWSVLAVTVINAPDQGSLGLPATLTAVSAILVIAAVHLNRLNEGWQRRRVSVLPGTDGRFAAAAAIGGVVVVLLALVVPPLTSSDLSSRLFGFGPSQPSHRGSGSGTGTGNGPGAEGTVRFSPSTVPGGPLTLSSTPVLTYTSSTQSGVYLQMATDGVFDGGNWFPDGSALNNGAFSEVVVAPGQIPRDRALGDGGVGALTQVVSTTVSISDDTSGSNVLPFPGEPEATSVQARASGLAAPGAVGPLLTVDSVSATSQVTAGSMVLTGTQPTATADQLRRAGTSYPLFIAADEFLQLPGDASGGDVVMRALAQQWTRGTTNPYDAATAIQNHLRDPTLFRYTLSPPLPPKSSQIWPVTYFLTTSHAGYCQYFATAMGAMLRALGIPSRLVNGYGPGASPNSAARGVDSETVWQVTSNDAHTWVEAYFPGYGWIPFEPTPPSQAGGDYQPFARGGTSPPSAVPSRAPSAAPTRAPAGGVHAGGGTAAGGGFPAALVLRVAGGLGAVAAVLVLFATWLWRPRGVPGIWRRVRLVGALAGVGAAPSLTFNEYAGRVSTALAVAPPGAGALADIAAITGRSVYSREGISDEDAGRAATAWHTLVRLLPAVGWRGLRRRRATP